MIIYSYLMLDGVFFWRVYILQLWFLVVRIILKSVYLFIIYLFWKRLGILKIRASVKQEKIFFLVAEHGTIMVASTLVNGVFKARKSWR